MMSNDLQLLWKNVIANIFLAKSCGVHKPFAQAWSISAIDYFKYAQNVFVRSFKWEARAVDKLTTN